MLLEGVKLTVIGMGVVFVFLVLLWTLMILLTKILASKTQLEILEHEKKERKSRPSSSGNDDEVMAAISMAIHTHRKKQKTS